MIASKDAMAVLDGRFHVVAARPRTKLKLGCEMDGSEPKRGRSDSDVRVRRHAVECIAGRAGCMQRAWIPDTAGNRYAGREQAAGRLKNGALI